MRRGDGGSLSLERLQSLLGGDVSKGELRGVVAAMSTADLTNVLSRGGVEELRRLIHQRRQTQPLPAAGLAPVGGAAGDGKAAGGGKDMAEIARSIVVALVGDQLGPAGSDLFKDMVGKVRGLLDSNFAHGDGELLSGLLGAGNAGQLVELLERERELTAAKPPASRGRELGTAAAPPTKPIGSETAWAGTAMPVWLAIEKDRSGKWAGLGLAFGGYEAWDYGKVGSGMQSDEELLVEACAELVMFLADRVQRLYKEAVHSIKVKLVATPSEVARVDGLLKGEWGRYLDTRLKGYRLPTSAGRSSQGYRKMLYFSASFYLCTREGGTRGTRGYM